MSINSRARCQPNKTSIIHIATKYINIFISRQPLNQNFSFFIIPSNPKSNKTKNSLNNHFKSFILNHIFLRHFCRFNKHPQVFINPSNPKLLNNKPALKSFAVPSQRNLQVFQILTTNLLQIIGTLGQVPKQ